MKKAFTMAEIIVVLLIIGILTAILIPIMTKDASENEKLLKFLKGHDTLQGAFSELITSDKYFLNGDLGLKPNGELINGAHNGDRVYLCEKLSEVISNKSVKCLDANTGINGYISCAKCTDNSSYTGEKRWLDAECKLVQPFVQKKKNEQPDGIEIESVDNIFYFQTSPDMLFGLDVRQQIDYYCSTSVDAVEKETQSYCKSSTGVGKRAFGGTLNQQGFDVMYKTICFDIDGVPEGATKDDCINECPFGYGVRVDGKIVNGERADVWLKKTIEEK